MTFKNKFSAIAIMFAMTPSLSWAVDSASETFTWKGMVPDEPIVGTYRIYNAGGIDFNDGTLIVTQNGSSTYNIRSVGDIRFSVASADDDTDIKTTFNMDLSSFMVIGSDGGIEDAPSSIDFLVNDIPIDSSNASYFDINSVSVEGTLDSLTPDTEVAIQATVIVSNIS